MKQTHLFIYFYLSFFIATLATAQSFISRTDANKVNTLLTQDITNINFQSPLILSNSILFFYKGMARTVQIAGEFNNWQNNLFMTESRPGLWTISLTNRINAGTYQYRLKVDGFWIADPNNTNAVYDIQRQKLSTFTLGTEFAPDKKRPFWISNDIYLFEYHNTNATIVTIAGDFNDWNPYSHELKFQGAGTFSIELTLKSNQIYLYSFVADGKWEADPNNKKQFRNDLNRPVSAFFANGATSIP